MPSNLVRLMCWSPQMWLPGALTSRLCELSSTTTHPRTQTHTCTAWAAQAEQATRMARLIASSPPKMSGLQVSLLQPSDCDKFFGAVRHRQQQASCAELSMMQCHLSILISRPASPYKDWTGWMHLFTCALDERAKEEWCGNSFGPGQSLRFSWAEG